MSSESCDDCSRSVIGRSRRGRCEPCYRKHVATLKDNGNFSPLQRRSGSFLRKEDGLLDFKRLANSLFGKVAAGYGGCWIYTGRLDKHGYGASRKCDGKHLRPHQIAYLGVVGHMPPGATLDHLCHSTDVKCLGGRTCIHRRCINPAHLEPVSGTENIMRGNSPSAINARKTECVNGHRYSAQNTEWASPKTQGGSPHRRCLTCRPRRRPPLVSSDLETRKGEATKLTQPTIPPEAARHVLWFYGRDGGAALGGFTQYLISVIDAAGLDDVALLANAYPGLVAAVLVAKLDPDGMAALQRVAGPLACARCGDTDGPLGFWADRSICESCMAAFQVAA